MLLYKTVCALSTASLSVPVSVCGFKETIQHCLNPRRLFITFQGKKKEIDKEFNGYKDQAKLAFSSCRVCMM